MHKSIILTAVVSTALVEASPLAAPYIKRQTNVTGPSNVAELPSLNYINYTQ